MIGLESTIHLLLISQWRKCHYISIYYTPGKIPTTFTGRILMLMRRSTPFLIATVLCSECCSEENRKRDRPKKIDCLIENYPWFAYSRSPMKFTIEEHCKSGASAASVKLRHRFSALFRKTTNSLNVFPLSVNVFSLASALNRIHKERTQQKGMKVNPRKLSDGFMHRHG